MLQYVPKSLFYKITIKRGKEHLVLHILYLMPVGFLLLKAEGADSHHDKTSAGCVLQWHGTPALSEGCTVH